MARHIHPGHIAHVMLFYRLFLARHGFPLSRRYLSFSPSALAFGFGLLMPGIFDMSWPSCWAMPPELVANETTRAIVNSRCLAVENLDS